MLAEDSNSVENDDYRSDEEDYEDYRSDVDEDEIQSCDEVAEVNDAREESRDSEAVVPTSEVNNLESVISDESEDVPESCSDVNTEAEDSNKATDDAQESAPAEVSDNNDPPAPVDPIAGNYFHLIQSS